MVQRFQYPIDESAQILGISKHTMIRDIRLGRIRTVRYGKRILIPHDELVRLSSEGMPLPEK